MVKLLDFIDGLVTEVRFRTKSVIHKQIQSCKRATDKALRSVHFGVVIEELINCKCGGIVRNEIW